MEYKKNMEVKRMLRENNHVVALFCQVVLILVPCMVLSYFIIFQRSYLPIFLVGYSVFTFW